MMYTLPQKKGNYKKLLGKSVFTVIKDQTLQKLDDLRLLRAFTIVNVSWKCIQEGPVSQFGILGFQEKNLGFWDFTLFEVGILEIRCKIWILAIGTWDLTLLKPGFGDFAPFEIGILGFHPF